MPPPPEDFASQRSGLAAGDVPNGTYGLEALENAGEPGLKGGGCGKAKAIHLLLPAGNPGRRAILEDGVYICIEPSF